MAPFGEPAPATDFDSPWKERQLREAIREWEEERAMPYVTSIERLGRSAARRRRLPV